MLRLRAMVDGLLRLLGSRRSELELEEELHAFLESSVEEKTGAGLTREAALRAARLEVGSVAAVKDRVNDAGWESFVESVAQDVRYAARMLRRSPGFAAMAILTLALGIGANSAIFSVASAVLFQPLPYPDADRLVAIKPFQRDRPAAVEPVSHPTFQDWRRRAGSFESLAAYVVAGSTLTGRGEPTIPVTAAVTSNLFSLLGGSPALGRMLMPADDDPAAPPVVLLSDQFWRERFAGSPGVVGEVLLLDGTPHAVVGVLPPEFRFPHVSPAPALWMPLRQFKPFQALLTERQAPMLSVVGRLRSGRTIADAQAEMATVAGDLARQYPAVSQGQVLEVMALQRLVVAESRSSVLMLIAAVGLLLLIACTNVGSLQLAQMLGRGREISMRAALGAGRRRLFRQVLVESLVLTLTGGALGVLVAHWTLQALSVPIARELPSIREIGIDRWVLGLTFALSCAVGVLFALLPVAGSTWFARRLRLNGPWRTSDSRNTRTQGLLVVSEVALTLVLLISAGLLLRSLVQLQRVDTGFHADKLITATINLPQSEYARPEQWLAFNNELLERIKTLPGVDGAALGVGVPFLQPPFAVPFSIEGRSSIRPGERTSVPLVEASPDYFEVMRIRLDQGRAFADSDVRQSQRVAIVNRAFVRQYFGEEDPIGRTVGLGEPNPIRLQVVGVVADTVQSSVVVAPPALLYLPFAQRPFWITSFVIRGSAGTDGIANAFRHEVFRLAPTVPVLAVESMDESVKRSFAASRYRTLLLTLLSVVALILAIVGIHGIVSYHVVRRTHEIGIRMALGARPRLVLRGVLEQGLRLAIAGIAVGLLISVVVSRFLERMLFRVSANDPLTLIGVALLVLIVTLAASFIPARHATKVDPLIALRFE